jgi:hypothetical protein
MVVRERLVAIRFGLEFLDGDGGGVVVGGGATGQERFYFVGVKFDWAMSEDLTLTLLIGLVVRKRVPCNGSTIKYLDLCQ